MARERAKALHQSKQATVCGIYSRKLENTCEFCDLTGAEGFADYGRMLECADAVVICLPNFLHTESSRVALYSKPLQGSWYMDKTCHGGLFAAFHYHHIEYYRRLLGTVVSVYANEESVAEYTGLQLNSTTGGSLVMQHKGGGTSCIQWYLSRYGDSLPRGMWINGTKDSVTVVSHEDNKSLVLWGQGKDGDSEVINDSWGISGSTDDFIQAILGNMDHQVRLALDISTLRVGQTADESAKQQQKIRVTYYE